MPSRTQSATKTFDEPAKQQPTYSPLYTLSPDTDLVLQSSDGVLFATRTLYVRAASYVFDEILGMPPSVDEEKRDGHLLLKIEEESEVVTLFLMYTGRGAHAYTTTPLPLWAHVELLSKMFDKYDAPLLAVTFVKFQLPRFLGDQRNAILDTSHNVKPHKVFALAVIHGVEDVARQALRWHDKVWQVLSKNANGYVSFSHHPDYEVENMMRGRPCGPGDLPLDLLGRLELKHLKQYCELHAKVVSYPTYSWTDAADDFNVSHRRLVRSVPVSIY